VRAESRDAATINIVPNLLVAHLLTLAAPYLILSKRCPPLIDT